MWHVKRGDPNLTALTLKVGRLVEDFSVGLRESLARGYGSDHLGLKPYEAGDSTRDIAWRASARNPKEDELLVNVYSPEKQIRVLIVADEHISMRVPSLKPYYAQALVRLLALSAAEESDSFAVLGMGGDGLVFSEWLSNESQLSDFLNGVDDVRHRAMYRPAMRSFGEFLGEQRLKNLFVIFLTDLSSADKIPLEALSELDPEKNVRCAAVVLDEWSGFSPTSHSVVLQHSANAKIATLDMREGGGIQREVNAFKKRLQVLRNEGKMPVLTVPLVDEDPLRSFYRQWVRYFEAE